MMTDINPGTEIKKIKFPVKNQYRNKKRCLEEADRILEEDLIDSMTRKEIAREIYFHAMAHHFCEKTHWFPGVKEHADLIELADGGDTPFRRFVYRLLWILVPTRRR